MECATCSITSLCTLAKSLHVKRLENWQLDRGNFTNEEQQKLWILLSHRLIGHGIFTYIKHKFKPHVGRSVYMSPISIAVLGYPFIKFQKQIS